MVLVVHRYFVTALLLAACGDDTRSQPSDARADAPQDGPVDAAIVDAPPLDAPVDASRDAPIDAPPLFDCAVAPTLDAGQPLVGVCTSDRWCWQHPLPQGNTIYALWASGTGDAWAVGEAGTVLHWTGTAWQWAAGGTRHQLDGVWGSSAADVWVVGENGTILHVTGGVLNSVGDPTGAYLHGVAGSGANDVWAVGDGGAIRHWNGTAWSPIPSGTTASLNAVWSSGASDAWAVGDAGTTLHWTGSAWSPVATNAAYKLTGVWGSSANDVWAVGHSNNDGTVLHWTGSAWSATTIPQLPFGITGTSATDLWIPSANNTVLHGNGTSFSVSTTGDFGILYAIFAVGANDIWTAGNLGRTHHFDGNAWSDAAPDPLWVVQFASVWAIAGDDVWAVGSTSAGGVIARFDGSTWSRMPSGTLPVLYGVWASASDDVWMVGQDANALHWDGSTLSSIPTGVNASFQTVTGSGRNDAWALTSGNQLVHLTTGGVTSIQLTTPQRGWTDVWASGPNDVWVAGADGAIVRWNGVTQNVMQVGRPLGKIWGCSASDVWAAGVPAMHWNGSSWSVVPVTACNNINGANTGAIWGSGHDDVWMADGNGCMYHYDGTVWSTATAPIGWDDNLAHLIYGLRGEARGALWAVGEGGAILRHVP
jgi:hypothetical protein